MNRHAVLRSDALWYATCVLLFGIVALFRESPYMLFDTRFGMFETLVWSCVVLVGGILANRPRALLAAVFVCALGPMHTIALCCTGVALLWLLLRSLRRSDAYWSLQPARIGRPLLVGAAALMIWLTVSWLLRLGNGSDASAWPLLFISMFLVPVFWLCAAMLEWKDDDLIWLVRRATFTATAMLTVVLLQPLVTGSWDMYRYAGSGLSKLLPIARPALPPHPLPFSQQPFDFNWGSMASAHYASVLFVLLGVGALAYGVRTRTIRALLLAAAAGIGCVMTENLHALPGALVLLVVAMIGMASTSRVVRTAMFISTLAVTLLLPLSLVHHFYVDGTPLERSRKGVLIYDTWSSMRNDPVNAFFGAGPGTFGSKVADMRLPLRYREIGSNLPATFEFVAPAYQHTLNAVQTVPQFLPPLHVPLFSTMGRMMSGANGILREFGLFGTALLFVCLAALLRSVLVHARTDAPLLRTIQVMAAGFIPLLGSLSVFRHYAEYPDIMTAGMLLVMIGTAATHNQSRAVA